MTPTPTGSSSLSLKSLYNKVFYGNDAEINTLSRTATYYFDGGYVDIKITGSGTCPITQFYYYAKDHLGNIRSVVTKNSQGVVSEVQKTHYYPFGGIIADISTGRSVQDRLYNGKELDTACNLWWYDFGARQYDPASARFTTPDLLGELTYNQNYYIYANNNPVFYVDLLGLKGYNPNEANKIWKNFDINNDWIKLDEVFVYAKKYNTSNNYASNSFGLHSMHWNNRFDVAQYSIDFAAYKYNGMSTNIKSNYVYKSKKYLKTKYDINIKTKNATIYRKVIPNFMKQTSKKIGIGSAVLTLGSNLYETWNSQDITIGRSIDSGMAVLGLTPYGVPIFITYSVADILLQVTTDKGIGDYIDDASESLIGGNSIYSW